jgi:hypothetical protein
MSMSVRPETEPQEIVLEFEVDVSDAYIEGYIETLGVEPPRRWSIEFDLQDVSPPLRSALRDVHARYVSVDPYPQFPAPTDDPEEFLNLITPWLDDVEQEEAAQEEERQAEERQAEERQKVFLSAMADWARDQGSPRLRAAIDRGYKANTTYALERAAQEVPGFWVDTAGDAEWGERSDPSEEALDLEESVQHLLAAEGIREQAKIVWLTAPPRLLSRWLEDDQGEYFEPQEAILVTDYLDRYPIVLPVDPDLRRGDF